MTMDSQWLKTQFQLNPDKTKAGLAVAIGLEPPAVSKILNGTRQIKAQEYILMRHYFGMPVDGHHAVKPLNGQNRGIGSNEKGFAENKAKGGTDEWTIPTASFSSLQKESENVRIFQVRDNFMEPVFNKGEYVLVDLADKKISSPGIFIISDGYSHMLRRCEEVKKPSGPEIRISASSSAFQPQTLKNDDILILGRVLARLQMLSEK